MRILQSGHASRVANGQAVLRTIVQASVSLSRAEIARELGLSKQTLSEIVALLEQAQWIQEVGQKKGVLGRSAVGYQLNPDVGYVVGIILEGKRFSAGLADMCGVLRAEFEGRLNQAALTDGDTLAQQVQSMIEQLMKSASIGADKLSHMVIGCSGLVDQTTMRVVDSQTLPALVGLDIHGFLKNRYHCPVLIENDLNLYAYGEYRFGRSQNTSSNVFIGVGTGIGMGIMMGDSVWQGAWGGAGEIGRLPVGLQAPGPEPLARGALEFALTQPPHAQKNKTPAAVFEENANNVARCCAFAIACIAPIMQPEMVVLGGPQGDNPQVHALLPQWLASLTQVKVNVQCSALGASAGLMGAAARGIKASQDSLFHKEA